MVSKTFTGVILKPLKMVEAEGNRTLVRKPLTTASTSLARNLILT